MHANPPSAHGLQVLMEGANSLPKVGEVRLNNSTSAAFLTQIVKLPFRFLVPQSPVVVQKSEHVIFVWQLRVRVKKAGQTKSRPEQISPISLAGARVSTCLP
jgi:hypothetical protein